MGELNSMGEDKMNTPIYTTQQGLNKMQEELDYLLTVKRREVAEALKIAASFGDLAENSEYDVARIAQSELEHKILVLQDKISNVHVVEVDENDLEQVKIGLTVEVHVIENGVDMGKEEYTIVGQGEMDTDQNKITQAGPVGAGLIGMKVGESKEITIPDGIAVYEVLDIKYVENDGRVGKE